MEAAVILTDHKHHKTREDMDHALQHVLKQIRFVEQKITTSIEKEIAQSYDKQIKNIQAFKTSVTHEKSE